MLITRGFISINGRFIPAIQDQVIATNNYITFIAKNKIFTSDKFNFKGATEHYTTYSVIHISSSLDAFVQMIKMKI